MLATHRQILDLDLVGGLAADHDALFVERHFADHGTVQ